MPHDGDAYQLLRDVSHWTDEVVERERAARRDVKATYYVFESGFSELLANFEFVAHPGRRLQPDQVPHLIEAWKTIVDVQQHFNDLELRIRSLAITLIGAFLAAVAFAIKEELSVDVHPLPATVLLGVAIGGWLAAILLLNGNWYRHGWRSWRRWGLFLLALALATIGTRRGLFTPGFTLSVPAMLVASSQIFLLAFWMMDRHWYHRLLQGAVTAGESIENKLADQYPEISLGNAISKASPVTLFGVEIHSPAKINAFYGMLSFGLIVLFLLFTFD